MTVGNIQDADQCNTIIAAGRADLAVLARAHLTDPTSRSARRPATAWRTLRGRASTNARGPPPENHRGLKLPAAPAVLNGAGCGQAAIPPLSRRGAPWGRTRLGALQCPWPVTVWSASAWCSRCLPWCWPCRCTRSSRLRRRPAGDAAAPEDQPPPAQPSSPPTRPGPANRITPQQGYPQQPQQPAYQQPAYQQPAYQQPAYQPPPQQPAYQPPPQQPAYSRRPSGPPTSRRLPPRSPRPVRAHPQRGRI